MSDKRKDVEWWNAINSVLQKLTKIEKCSWHSFRVMTHPPHTIQSWYKAHDDYSFLLFSSKASSVSGCCWYFKFLSPSLSKKYIFHILITSKRSLCLVLLWCRDLSDRQQKNRTRVLVNFCAMWVLRACLSLAAEFVHSTAVALAFFYPKIGNFVSNLCNVSWMNCRPPVVLLVVISVRLKRKVEILESLVKSKQKNKCFRTGFICLLYSARTLVDNGAVEI